jgi:hypothetical protein
VQLARDLAVAAEALLEGLYMFIAVQDPDAAAALLI